MVSAELLDSFVAFAETLNFTHAAKKTGLSQPALFERIRRLEESLGAPLYEREGRALTLTEAGTRTLAFSREARTRFADFLTELRNEAPRRTVTLAAGEGSYLYLLGPALAAFAKAHGPSLELLTVGGRGVLECLRRGDADLAVAAIDLVPSSIHARDIVTTPLCVALPAHHPLASHRRLRLRDLAGERFVLAPEGQLHRDLVSRALASGGHTPSRVLEADGWPLMLAFVKAGLGVAVVNGICELPRGVVTRPLRELGSVTYRLLQRKSARQTPEAELLASKILALGAPRPGV
ncbi:MAG: LysR family transcriptional regulator [Deltaproteobacteria bacterium]|nr:LysR family transcriptional regulator [Deltaproteobacteria bacterium]